MSKIRSKEAKLRQQKARQKRLMQRVWDYKLAHPCRCGESRPQCLEFHHLDPATKSDEVMHFARYSHSWSKIQAEIAKCEVVCANCHKAKHFDELAVQAWEGVAA